MIENKAVTSENSSLEFQEAYNILRTNLNYALSGEKSKIIALTDSNRSDGVNTVALNLALSFAQIDNNKVLLIDGNMHLSALSAMLELSGKAGLSDCLSGNAEKENCIVSMEGIDVLPSGEKPSNPANLLDSKTADKFFDDLRKCYDFIFIVLPSVCLWSDGEIFAKYADGFLPVVRHDFTRFKEIRALERNLRIAGGNILGFVYNRAPLKRKNKLV